MPQQYDRNRLVSNMRVGLEWLQKNINTCMPGEVVSYEWSTGRAVVKPSIRVRLQSGEEADLPAIDDVPVLWLAGGGFSLTVPLAEGDPVLLLFSQRGLTEWKESLEVSSPDRGVFHALNDAIAIPGFTSGEVARSGFWIQTPPQGRVWINSRRVEDIFAGPQTWGNYREAERVWRTLLFANMEAGEWYSVALDPGPDQDGIDPHSDLSIKYVVNGGASSVQLISARDILRETARFSQSPSSTSSTGVIRVVFSEFHDGWIARHTADNRLWVRSEPASEITIEELKWRTEHHYHPSAIY